MNEIQLRPNQTTVVRANQSAAIVFSAMVIACAFAWGFGVLATLSLSILVAIPAWMFSD